VKFPERSSTTNARYENRIDRGRGSCTRVHVGDISGRVNRPRRRARPIDPRHDREERLQLFPIKRLECPPPRFSARLLNNETVICRRKRVSRLYKRTFDDISDWGQRYTSVLSRRASTKLASGRPVRTPLGHSIPVKIRAVSTRHLAGRLLVTSRVLPRIRLRDDVGCFAGGVTVETVGFP